MANKHMKGCSISLFVKELQIKTTMRYDFILVRMANIKKQKVNICVRKLVPLCTAGENV